MTRNHGTMQPSKGAQETIENVLEEITEDFNCMGEYDNSGVCYKCGHLSYSIESDAVEAECEECGENAMHGMLMVALEAM